MTHPTLSDVHIRVADLDRAVAIYAAICGSKPPGIDDRRRATVMLDRAWLRLTEDAGRGRTGVAAITLRCEDLEVAFGRLQAASLSCDQTAQALVVGAGSANGVEVRIQRPPSRLPGPAEASLDHVALLVRDLTGASAAWEQITGVPAVQMGLHPISNGAFSAARILLDDRMVELISPTAGVDSPLAKRLAGSGEGPVTLALPVGDVDAARDRLEKVGAKVIWQDPHWMVHPGSTGGVLVQLTPRVAH